jgi:DNA-binding LacI/PurR family transcriptional regulator
MVTIADVAQRSGVSMMTVSRVINHKGYVGKETRLRVEQAVHDLGYRPNMVAKGLVTGRNKLIAYVTSDISSPFNTLISEGLENAAFVRDYTVIIYDANSLKRVSLCVDMLIDRQIDGVIFHNLQITAKQTQRLSSCGVQCITIDNEEHLDDTSSIDSDNYTGAQMAVRHLIGKGHRNIGCIQGCLGGTSQDTYIDQFQRRVWLDRTQGFLDGLASAGLKPYFILEGNSSMQQGFIIAQEFIRELLKSNRTPSAVYCENDYLALGALSELLETGRNVPGEMAVIGHSGIEMCTMLYPRVTTIVLPRYQMGYAAASMLLDKIERSIPIEHRIMDSTLFQGDTT